MPELEAYYDPHNRAVAGSWAAYGGAGRPVLLFDEIEHGFDGVMNMLQNGVVSSSSSRSVRSPASSPASSPSSSPASSLASSPSSPASSPSSPPHLPPQDGAWVYHREDPHDKSQCPQVSRPTAGSIIILTSNCYEDELRVVTSAVREDVGRYDAEEMHSIARRCAELCEPTDEPCLVACEVERRMTSRIMKDALPCGVKKALEPFELVSDTWRIE